MWIFTFIFWSHSLLPFLFLLHIISTEGPKIGGGEVTEQLSRVLTSLQPWSNYSITVRASTLAGEGVQSKPIICKTLQDGNVLLYLNL